MGGNAQCTAALAERLWPAIAADYVTHALQPQLDRLQDDAVALEDAAQRAVALEHAATGVHMAPQGAPGPLAAAAKQALDALVHTKRAALVAQARAVLLASDMDEAPVHVGQPLPTPQHPPASADSPPAEDALDWGPPGEEAPVTATGTFATSPAAQHLAELAASAVQQGAESGSVATAQSMCLAVRDIASLVVTVPPVLRVCGDDDCMHALAMMCTAHTRVYPCAYCCKGVERGRWS